MMCNSTSEGLHNAIIDVAIIICVSLPEAFHLRDAERWSVPSQWGLTLLRFSAQIEHIPLEGGDVSGTNQLAVELHRNGFKLTTLKGVFKSRWRSFRWRSFAWIQMRFE
jgi:hypothetical protein